MKKLPKFPFFRLLERLNEVDLAASAYADLANEKIDINTLLTCKQDFVYACTFLAKYYAARKDIDQAKYFANQLKRHPEVSVVIIIILRLLIMCFIFYLSNVLQFLVRRCIRKSYAANSSKKERDQLTFYI